MKKNMAEVFLNELKTKWKLLQNSPNVFAYNLNVSQRKYLLSLPGEEQQRFYVELNPERSTLRRTPQTIISLDPKFDDSKFNFKKINPLELIVKMPHEGDEISLIVNRSPLTPYHTLICPDVEAGHAQRMTLGALCFSVDLLRNLAGGGGVVSEDANAFRIGYNSPGALASVNHLHLHLMHITTDLYIDGAKLDLLAGTHIYRLSENMPTEAICFVINKTDDEELVKLKLKELNAFIMWLCDHNMPHNLFMTAQRGNLSCGAPVDSLKIFIYAREKHCVVKNLASYNVGFCELSGYIPVGDKELFDSLTQRQVIAKICEETGQVYKEIYKYFAKQ